jgi:hypothetical protein
MAAHKAAEEFDRRREGGAGLTEEMLLEVPLPLAEYQDVGRVRELLKSANM